MFRKRRQPTPYYRLAGQPFNPITGEHTHLSRPPAKGTTLAIFQVIGDDPDDEETADTHDNYVVCRGYDPDADPEFRFKYDPYTNESEDAKSIKVAKPWGVRGTFPYVRGQIVVAAKIRTKLGDNQGVADDTIGHPADLDEAIHVLLDDDDVAISWLDISTPPNSKQFWVTNGTLSHGGSVQVERLKRQSGAWVRSGELKTAYDIFLNTIETVDAGTIVSTVRYEGVDVLDSIYCRPNDWLD